MSYINFDQVNKNKGIITNLPTRKVNWSVGRNVRFVPGAVAKNWGKTLLATVPGTPAIRNMFTFKGFDGLFRTIVCTDTKIYAYKNDFTEYSDITPASPPTSGANDNWSFTLIGGMPIVSNGVDRIWSWPDFDGVMEATTLVGTGPTRAGAIEADQQRLLTGNVTENGFDYSCRIRWSRYFLPFDYTVDEQQMTDSQDLLEPGGNIDAREKIQNFGNVDKRKAIFTERNIWYSDPVDSPAQHSIDIWHPGVGLLSPRLVVSVLNHNYFMGLMDIYDLGPEGLNPIGFDVRNFVFPNLNKSALGAAFSFYRPWTREVFFCFPTGSDTVPDTAVVYQTELENMSICDIDYLCHNYSWLQTSIEWDTIPYGSWDSIEDSRWSDFANTGIIPYEVVANAYGQIFKVDGGYNNNGSAVQGYIESGDFGDESCRKQVLRVYPLLKPISTRQPLMVQVGGRENLHSSIKWSPPRPVAIGVDRYAPSFTTGRYVRVRFYTDQVDSPWVLEGYGMEYNDIGG